MVCGPTAAGKSALADDLADALSAARGVRVPTVVVDSVQVYRGLAEISNQARRRPAELVGAVPVTERWTVARHREAARKAVAQAPDFVLDAGTGMYLNAILLGVDLAPPVENAIRVRAQAETAQAENPRRAARGRELDLAGSPGRGSIWEGDLVYRTKVLYVRPPRHVLDRTIEARSAKISRRGVEEAREIRALMQAGEDVNPSVLDAVGVKELLDLLAEDLTPQLAHERIAARTRRLARRQTRWFDKLARTLGNRAGVSVFEVPSDPKIWHTMRDTLGT